MSKQTMPARGRRRTCAMFAGLGLLAAAPALQAQEAYPAKPLTMVVPFPPGGVADTVGRPVAEALSRILEQPVVVENKAGAGGGIGMAQVAKAKPDGYTILLALSSITILPEADRVLERSPMYQPQGPAADRPLHRGPDGPGGARQQPLEDGQGIHRRRKGAARRDHLRLVRQLRHHARADGDAQAGLRHLHAARAVHRRRPSHHRPDRRAGRCARYRPCDHRAACQVRAAARPCALGRRQACCAAGRAEPEGTGLPRDLLAVGRLVRTRRTRRRRW